MPLFHGPDGDDKAAADTEDSCQLPQRSHPPLCRREVMDYSDGQHGVETVVPEWQGEVITEQHLQASQNVMFKADSHIACHSHAAPMPFPCHAMPLRV